MSNVNIQQDLDATFDSFPADQVSFIINHGQRIRWDPVPTVLGEGAASKGDMPKVADSRSRDLEGHRRLEEEIPNLFEVSHFHAMVRR
jgi:hypothetical protein